MLKPHVILNNESLILFYLRKRQEGGQVHFEDLAQLVGLSKGWMSSILTKLEKEGLIRSSMDGKRKKYAITERGLMEVINALEFALNEEEIRKINLK